MPRKLARHGLYALCAVLSGCGGGGSTQKSCPIGDPTQPAQLEIVNLGADQATSSVTQASAKVPLIPPPQGGWIMLIGARAKNVDGCQLTLTTALLDACDGTILQLDRRPTVLDDDGDGWGTSSVTTYGNLPVCPTLTSTRDLHEVPYVVKVVIEDVNGQKATQEITVVPTCGDEPSRCTCECGYGYKTGQSCDVPPPDAGVPETCVDASS